MKNKIKFIIIVLILFLNIFLYLIPSNYTKKYKIQNYNIIEKYVKKDGVYLFTVKDGQATIDIAIYNKYKAKKGLIKKITKIDIENGYCLEFQSDKIDFYPICKQDDEYKFFYLINGLDQKISSSYYKKIKSNKTVYQSLKIYNLFSKKYLLWNYSNFYYLSDKKNKTINLFDNDYYQIDLATLLNNYLFIPNYDDGYIFDDAFIININNGDISNWKLNNDISIDSRIIGTYNKSIYLLDEKSKVLYEIVPHKKKVRKVSGRILEDDKFVKYDIDTIIRDKMSFKPSSYFKYQVINNKLYLVSDNNRILLNNNDIDSIVFIDRDSVYYLVADTLYLFNPYYGNVKLISNFEWKFNNNNLIFIYEPNNH